MCTQVSALQQRCVQVGSHQNAYKMIFIFVFVSVFVLIISFICCCMLLYLCLCTEDRALQCVQVGPHQLAPFKQTCHSPPRQTCPNQNIIRILEQQQLVRISISCRFHGMYIIHWTQGGNYNNCFISALGTLPYFLFFSGNPLYLRDDFPYSWSNLRKRKKRIVELNSTPWLRSSRQVQSVFIGQMGKGRTNSLMAEKTNWPPLATLSRVNFHLCIDCLHFSSLFCALHGSHGKSSAFKMQVMLIIIGVYIVVYRVSQNVANKILRAL